MQKFQYRLRDQRPHQVEARRLAVQYAREKASHLAELNGMKLGKAMRVYEGVEWNASTGDHGGMGGFFNVLSAPPRKDGITTAEIDSSAAQQSPEKALVQQKAAVSTLNTETQPKPQDNDPVPDLISPRQVIIEATVTIVFELVEQD